MAIKVKNIYEKPQRSDGCRVLVMRYWPRGISKDKIDIWEKELGTEVDLIKKWKTESISWAEFSKEYIKFASKQKEKLKELVNRAENKTLTLLCSCKDEEHCHRTLLKKLIDKNQS